MNLKEAQDLLLQGYSCEYDEKDLDKLFKLFDIEGVSQENNEYINGESRYYHVHSRKWDGYRSPYYRNKAFNLSEVNMKTKYKSGDLVKWKSENNIYEVKSVNEKGNTIRIYTPDKITSYEYTLDSDAFELYEPEFVLPENWHVVVTEENKEDILKWYNCSAQIGNIVGMVKWDTWDIHKGWNRSNIKNESYDYGIEITYDQFLKYVLKQENMKTTKQLMGYKLIKPEYEKLVDELANGVKLNDIKVKRDYYCIVDNRFSIEKFKTAGVLSLWFESVYEEQIISYSEGDYLFCKENFYMSRDTNKAAPVYIKGKVYKSEKLNCITDEEGSTLHKMNVDYKGGQTFNDHFRFATEEEIEKLYSKTFELTLGDKGIIVKISKDKITADGKNWNIDYLNYLSNICYNSPDICDYRIEFPHVKIGC